MTMTTILRFRPAVRSDIAPSRRIGTVGLADMDAIQAQRLHQIRAVVEDDGDPVRMADGGQNCGHAPDFSLFGRLEPDLQAGHIACNPYRSQRGLQIAGKGVQVRDRRRGQ